MHETILVDEDDMTTDDTDDLINHSHYEGHTGGGLERLLMSYGRAPGSAIDLVTERESPKHADGKVAS